jgi:hypothetical protein
LERLPLTTLRLIALFLNSGPNNREPNVGLLAGSEELSAARISAEGLKADESQIPAHFFKKTVLGYHKFATEGFWYTVETGYVMRQNINIFKLCTKCSKEELDEVDQDLNALITKQ